MLQGNVAPPGHSQGCCLLHGRGQDLLAVTFACVKVRTQGGKVTCSRTDSRTGHLLMMVKVTMSAHHPGNTAS